MTKNSESATGSPQTGVKILDLTSVVMGPFATQITASLGADTIQRCHQLPMRALYCRPSATQGNLNTTK